MSLFHYAMNCLLTEGNKTTAQSIKLSSMLGGNWHLQEQQISSMKFIWGRKKGALTAPAENYCFRIHQNQVIVPLQPAAVLRSIFYFRHFWLSPEENKAAHSLSSNVDFIMA